MPKLKMNAPKKAKRRRMKDEMEKFKKGELHSGSKKGPTEQSAPRGRDLCSISISTCFKDYVFINLLFKWCLLRCHIDRGA